MSREPVRKVVVVVDLSRYSDITRDLEQHLGVRPVPQLNAQIQGFIREALRTAGLADARIPYKPTGDGAILVLDTAIRASAFAENLQRAAEAHNRGKTIDLAQRHFRVGVWTDDVVVDEQINDQGVFLGFELAGGAIGNAVRLEGACRTGEVLISSDTWGDLPPEERRAYGPEEQVAGKRAERFRAHRRRVVPPATWEAPGTEPLPLSAIPPPPSLPQARIDPQALLVAMTAAFSVEDLDVLCAHVERDLRKDGIGLAVNLEMVGGSGKEVKILNLIEYLRRRGHLAYLVNEVHRARPGLIGDR